QASMENSPTPMSLFNAAGDSGGHFSLTDLPPGTYDISLISASTLSMATASAVVVGAGGQVNLGAVQLQPMTDGGTPPGPPIARDSNTATDTIHADYVTVGPDEASGNDDSIRFDPGITTPLFSFRDASVLAADNYLNLVWIDIASRRWGF